MDEVEVVVAHQQRATLRVGYVFLKIDAEQARTDIEVEATALASIPTPEILWRKPARARTRGSARDGTRRPRRAVARGQPVPPTRARTHLRTRLEDRMATTQRWRARGNTEGTTPTAFKPTCVTGITPSTVGSSVHHHPDPPATYAHPTTLSSA